MKKLSKDRQQVIKVKKYDVDVCIKFSETVEATSKDEVLRKVKESYSSEYGMNLANKEITITKR